MIKQIKGTDTVKGSMFLFNDNFKELDERLEKIEKKLKISKKKK